MVSTPTVPDPGPPPAALALAHQWLADEPQSALANFTWVNNVTTAAGHCHFAWDGTGAAVHCLARRRGLPFTAISVEGSDPAIVRRLAVELLPAGQSAYTLAPPRIAAVLGQAAQVEECHPEWQMVFRPTAAALDPGLARPLGLADLPAMQRLAQVGEAMVFSPESLQRGAFFGVFAAAELVAMGGVQNELPGWAEIGSIVTHPAHRRQGYAAQVVSALIRHLAASDRRVFLCLFQTNTPARALYEKLGFAIANELQLLHWRLS